MIGERLKVAVDHSKLTPDEVASGLGVSKSNLYVLYKKPSFDVEYLKKACNLFDLPMSYFLEEKESPPPKPVERGVFGTPVLQEIREEMKLLREQLLVKDQQIAGLQRTVDVLVGKSEGAIVDLLSTDVEQFEKTMRVYQFRGLNQQNQNTDKSFFLAPAVAKLVAPRCPE